MEKFAIIMAGGSGTRLWPLTRETSSKQKISFYGDGSILEQTVERMRNAYKEDHIYISSGLSQYEHVQNCFGKSDNIFLQPMDRNNAPPLLLIAMKILKRHGDCMLTLIPSDHIVIQERRLLEAIEKSTEIVKDFEGTAAIGTLPLYPSEGFGYLMMENTDFEEGAKVLEFKEKPDLLTAGMYIKEGSCLWNTGIYSMKASSLICNFKRYLPKIYFQLSDVFDFIDTRQEKQKIEDVFPRLERQSIDYGIVERLDNLYAVKGDFDWIDTGSFETMELLYEKDREGNVILGDYIGVDSGDNIIYSKGRTLATVGVSDMIIIQTDDVTLVCDKKDSQKIRHLVKKIKGMNRQDIL